MALWTAEFSTEDAKLRAAQAGGFACLLAAALTVIVLMFASMAFSDGPTPALIAIAALAGIEFVVFVVAFVRLRAGKGLVWGCFAAALLALEIVGRLAALPAIAAMVIMLIDAVLLVGVVNGVRGTRVLGRPALSADQAGEVFK